MEGERTNGSKITFFIINGILFDNNKSKNSKPLSICIYDCKQCCDSLWHEEVTNDIYEAGVNDDKLALLYEINKVNNLAVKRQHGLTERKTVNNIICQGDPWGSMQCSVQVDGIGRDSLNGELEPFKYKNKVEIPVLGMVDDILTVSESGHKTSRMNGFINAKIATKKLQFGPKKCYVLHTGGDHESYKNFEVYVDGWVMTNVTDVVTGNTKRIDTLDGSMEMSHMSSEKYLGQVISSDGKNTKNIEKLYNKGIGIKNKILQMLETMQGGKYHFVIAKILRNSYLLSSILTSSEVWYGVTQNEIDKLEQVDEMLLRNLMDCSSSVPKDLIYLELGVVPIRFIIQTRRLLYLHHILQQNEESLIYRFFEAQLENPTSKDWVSQTLEDLEEFEINLELEEIQNMKKEKYKKIVNERVQKRAFLYLLD